MRVINHKDQPTEQWRPEVTTRMLVSAVVGSNQLCLFHQWCEPGSGAPTLHHAVEEVLTVLDGIAEVWLSEQRETVNAGQSVIIPAGQPHGFTNIGPSQLYRQFVLAAPIFGGAYEDHRETPRRWRPTAESPPCQACDPPRPSAALS
jgi:mannose-6-phosphate isomerase-like protein (cupin superfamily)